MRQGSPHISVRTRVPFGFAYSNLYPSIGAEIETRRRPNADARRDRDALVLVAGALCPLVCPLACCPPINYSCTVTVSVCTTRDFAIVLR
jgi:hypothetical protein